MSNDIDILQLKIEKARIALPEATVKAIDAVPWKITLLEMREKNKFNIEQMGDLEIETELLLCGLLSPDDYAKELEKRLRIPKAQVDVLVNEMNDLVFKKIREEMIKNTENKPQAIPVTPKPASAPLPDNTPKIETREEMLKKIESPDLTRKELPSGMAEHPILSQKLGGSFQIKPTQTEHTLENISKLDQKPDNSAVTPKASYTGKDPYRITPEE